MRSLTPTTVGVSELANGSARGGRVAVDPETGALYATVEAPAEFGLDISIVKLDGIDESSAFPDPIASFNTPVTAPFAYPAHAPQTIDVHYFPDDRSVIVLLAGGDIAVLQIDDAIQGTFVEVVGSIDSGIKAAAWSPDDEQLLLITGEDNLVCMTRSFDTIYEAPLRSDDFGEDKFINVGWGSKTTQFHGSLGKAGLMAARAAAAAPPPKSFSHATDDGLPRITFRGDGAYFAVSSLDPHPPSGEDAKSPGSRRQVRVYARDASNGHVPKLSATSESLPGLEGALAWRPSGNVIASLVRYGYEGGGEGRKGRWDVAMLERNGLRHGGFELREAEKTWENGYVHDMAWNADSEVLAIWIRREKEDVVQLWTMKNYHYYLKQEITPDTADSRFVSVRWHPENAMRLYLVSDKHVQVRSFVVDTYASRLPMPNDTASVAVVDGKQLLMTPFRTQNVPPPMSSYKLSFPEQVVHVNMSPSEDALAAIFRSGLVQVWDLGTRLPEAGKSRLRAGGKPAEPKLRWEQRMAPEGEFIAKQVCLAGNGEVAALFWGNGVDGEVIRIANANEVWHEESLLACSQHVLWEKEAGWLIAERGGNIRAVDESKPGMVSICPRPQSVAISAESRIVFAFSDTGRLVAASLIAGSDSCTLATGVTSFTITPDFLIYTTSSQSSHYAPLSSVQRVLDGEDVALIPDEDWEQRRVERGAVAVVACPSSMSLVLQMPRGNLETVYPRALVLSVVRRLVLAGEYREALLTCRKHCLDLNLIYDLAPAQFMERLPQFVQQVPEPDYLNLFVTALNSNDSAKTYFKDLARDMQRPAIPSDKVNAVCDALRALLETDLVKYVETILTTHVCKQPPDYEAGLRVLLQLQAEHPSIVEEAIKYIIFLSNVNQLYNVALGMYDFQLVLMIAQYSQKDPKEYLPFLRELRALDKYEQRFRIDDHLGRRESALRNLKAAGPERFDDASSYLSRYELYDTAFEIYKDDKEHLAVVHELYGDYLYDRRDFHDAAISYTLANKTERALKAYEKAHAWRELFTLAKEAKVEKERVLEMVERVNDHLSSRGRHLEAAQVYLDYASDVDAAVDVLCRGAEFSEAYRIASRFDRTELIEDLIHPALEEAQEALVEVFDEMEGQLDKEMKRLVELNRIRVADPDTFYLVDNEPELENVDVATNATTVATAFTRYTVAPTTVFSQSTRMTGHTNKSRGKKAKRRQAGRKGTVDEYDYLVASLGRLLVRVDDKSAEAIPLIRHLILASESHRELGAELQGKVKKLRARLEASLDEAWKDRETILDTVVSSGGMGLGGNVEPARALVKPEVKAWHGVPRLV